MQYQTMARLTSMAILPYTTSRIYTGLHLDLLTGNVSAFTKSTATKSHRLRLLTRKRGTERAATVETSPGRHSRRYLTTEKA